MRSKLARYPVEYSQILAQCPADGTPLEVTLSSPEAASRERMQFYNFLKFLARNPGESAHFGNRADLIMVSVKDCTIRFQLRVHQQKTELSAGLAAAMQHLNLPPPGQAVTTLVSAPPLKEDEVPLIPELDEPAQAPNLIDTFLDAVGKPADTNGEQP